MKPVKHILVIAAATMLTGCSNGPSDAEVENYLRPQVQRQIETGQCKGAVELVSVKVVDRQVQENAAIILAQAEIRVTKYIKGGLMSFGICPPMNYGQTIAPNYIFSQNYRVYCTKWSSGWRCQLA